MEFEDLQAIWDTQTERPVFAIDDSRLPVALYQQREHRLRRLFRFFYVPYYGFSLVVVVANALLALAFYFKTTHHMRTSDPRMSLWDGVAALTAVLIAALIAVRLHVERRKHERTQLVFAPSLREELDRGISQLNFELSLHGAEQVRKMTFGLLFGTLVFVWESGGLNGEPTPWFLLGTVLFCMLPSSWYNAKAEKAAFEELRQRKRAIESMRASLVE